MNFTFLDKYFGYYLKGAEITIVLAFFGVLFGTILGLGITLLRRSKIKIIKFIIMIVIIILFLHYCLKS